MDRDLPTGGAWHGDAEHYVVSDEDVVPYEPGTIEEMLLWMAFLGGFTAAWEEAEGGKDAAVTLRAHRAYQTWRQETAHETAHETPETTP